MRSLLLAAGLAALLLPSPPLPRSSFRTCRRRTKSSTACSPSREVTKDDVVFDLGSGDGRIPIAAARKYGAKGVGLDIDPERIKESWVNAKAAGVERLVDFREQDVLKADISEATVVTLYLLSSFNAQLRPILTKQLRPGTRIVSHAFSMGPTWPADKIDRFTTSTGDETTLYLWKADGKIRP